ncbi:MAG TPA: P1 family peptidase [Vicinamibacteria bacterium]|nr:P1 family peptidase [Vicinamibacteria bacterium]
MTTIRPLCAIACVTAFAATSSAAFGQAPERARDWGIPFTGTPGPLNAITDVPGVTVGMVTLIEGDGPLVKGRGPIRTGVTAILPRGKTFDPVYAGWGTLNGNGDMTGTHWITESGFMETPILITNTGNVGIVRDAAWQWMDRNRYYAPFQPGYWYAYPVVTETWDGGLNDINGQHVRPEHVWQALDSAHGGPVPEGAVGGGTGMVCHEFKGGTGTSSRKIENEFGAYTVGVLVQANYGTRKEMRLGGVPIGKQLLEVPLPVLHDLPEAVAGRFRRDADRGSIIVIIATDAPLDSIQCRRLALRAPIGIARMGGKGGNGSGDLFLAFATGNPGAFSLTRATTVTQFPNEGMNGLFTAVADATEEAISNALAAGRDMTGIQGNSVRGLPKTLVQDFLRQHGLMK